MVEEWEWVWEKEREKSGGGETEGNRREKIGKEKR